MMTLSGAGNFVCTKCGNRPTGCVFCAGERDRWQQQRYDTKMQYVRERLELAGEIFLRARLSGVAPPPLPQYRSLGQLLTIEEAIRIQAVIRAKNNLDHEIGDNVWVDQPPPDLPDPFDRSAENPSG